MEKRKVFYTEWAYCLGMILLAAGTALMEKAEFGMSMVVAPAYIAHLKLAEIWPFFSFGMAEYTLQAVILIIMALIMGRFKKAYFLSFATAVLYGFLLDGTMALAAFLPAAGMAGRTIFFLAGMFLCAGGVAMLFRTYFPPEAYELFVKEFSQKYRLPIDKTKTVYDWCSCILSIVLSLSLFGALIGVKWGTFVCAAFNGWLIGTISRFLEAHFVFQDALLLRDRL